MFRFSVDAIEVIVDSVSVTVGGEGGLLSLWLLLL